MGARFRYFDINHDGVLEFNEMWARMQEDDMQWCNFYKLFKSIIQYGEDRTISYDEIVQYFRVADPEATEAYIKEFFNQYNTDKSDDIIKECEMWIAYHMREDRKMRDYEQREE